MTLAHVRENGSFFFCLLLKTLVDASIFFLFLFTFHSVLVLIIGSMNKIDLTPLVDFVKLTFSSSLQYGLHLMSIAFTIILVSSCYDSVLEHLYIRSVVCADIFFFSFLFELFTFFPPVAPYICSFIT